MYIIYESGFSFMNFDDAQIRRWYKSGKMCGDFLLNLAFPSCRGAEIFNLVYFTCDRMTTFSLDAVMVSYRVCVVANLKALENVRDDNELILWSH